MDVCVGAGEGGGEGDGLGGGRDSAGEGGGRSGGGGGRRSRGGDGRGHERTAGVPISELKLLFGSESIGINITLIQP